MSQASAAVDRVAVVYRRVTGASGWPLAAGAHCSRQPKQLGDPRTTGEDPNQAGAIGTPAPFWLDPSFPALTVPRRRRRGVSG